MVNDVKCSLLDNIELQEATTDDDIQEVGGKIKLALLDESTSNISLDVEELFYNECIQNGLTLVSNIVLWIREYDYMHN